MSMSLAFYAASAFGLLWSKILRRDLRASRRAWDTTLAGDWLYIQLLAHGTDRLDVDGGGDILLAKVALADWPDC